MRGRGQSGRVLLAWREGSVQVGGGGWKGRERGGGGAKCARGAALCIEFIWNLRGWGCRLPV